MNRDWVGLIYCDTRRARGWEKALANAGIASRVLETIGDDAEHGAFSISVPRRDLPAANALVTKVTRGEMTLPGGGGSRTAIIALLVIAAMVAALARF